MFSKEKNSSIRLLRKGKWELGEENKKNGLSLNKELKYQPNPYSAFNSLIHLKTQLEDFLSQISEKRKVRVSI